MSGPVFLALRIALATALYLFVGWALVTLWRDLRRSARQAALPGIPALELLLEDSKSKQPMRFTSTEITIGRDPACQCHLEDKTISSHHARLVYRLGQWWIEDLNSTNGTFLNQEPVTNPVVVTQGDKLRCGQVEWGISIEDLNLSQPETGV